MTNEVKDSYDTFVEDLIAAWEEVSKEQVGYGYEYTLQNPEDLVDDYEKEIEQYLGLAFAEGIID